MSTTLWQYYQNLAGAIGDQSLSAIHSSKDWDAVKSTWHRQFMISMGLDPLPPRCELAVRDHGRLSGPGYQARKVSFQILPQCWASAIVYYPNPLPAPTNPGVLYVCGHSPIGVWNYQTHGIMWARRGYVCLVLDTIEQHDNSGDHHGTYYRYRYDWISRGYSGAGGELWNSMRAMDLLSGLPEVDASRIGCTGLSGGGALSFFMGIADERVRAVATCCGAAGIKETLRNRHQMAHCDCIYYHNIFQRSPSEYAALMAPRALAYCFADRDGLFTKGENKNLHEQTRKIYKLLGCEEKCQLFTYPGPHGYMPETITFINQWFDEHVAGRRVPDEPLADHLHSETETTIFNGSPGDDNKLAALPELLSPTGSVELPHTIADWPGIRDRKIAEIRHCIFSGPYQLKEGLKVEQVGDWDNGGGTIHRGYRGEIAGMEVWMDMLIPLKNSGKVLMGVYETETDGRKLLGTLDESAPANIMIGIEPRGSRFTAPHPSYEREFLRAGALTGATQVMLAINDILQCYAYFQTEVQETAGKPIYLYGRKDMGVACLYAALFEKRIAGVVADGIPATHTEGAYIPGIMRHVDIQHVCGLLAPRPVSLVNMSWSRRKWPNRLYARLGLSQRFGFSGNSVTAAFQNMLAE